jgi:hypothetical protein
MLDRPHTPAAPADTRPGKPRERDLRLDFFRGLTMFIIFLAHSPDNAWSSYIPAHFGFSSGAEVFVFCSGIASGMAFGVIFVKRGFRLGLMRVLFRIWQVYWAHICLTVAVLFVYLAVSKFTGEATYENIGGWLFVNNPIEGMIGIVTLRYFIGYMDILPMYLLLLGAIPLVMLLSKAHPLLPLAAGAALWLFIQAVNVWFRGDFLWPIEFPSTPDGTIKWHFNPLAWQLIFFIGFAFSIGWLKRPAFRKGWLFWLAIAYLVFAFFASSWVPMYWESYWRTGIWWRSGMSATDPAFWNSRLWDFKLWIHGGKQHGVTDLQVWRVVHVLALAYVILTLIDPVRRWLASRWAAPIVMVGQQSLATFMGSTALALVGSLILDAIGRNFWDQAIVNLAGFLGIVLIAYTARSFKAQPWRSGKGAAAQGGD